MDQIVPVNSTAMFLCKVTGVLVWEIDGREITSERQNAFCSIRGVCVNGTLDNSPDETTESVLLVAAIEENNGSMIKCLASETDISSPEESDTVILEIFDRPEPPTNLVFLPLSHLRLNLSWDAPFIFPGSEINYTVTVRNVNTSKEIRREGLEVTYYIFNGTEGSSMCDVYQFSVVAVNSAGRSDRSEYISSHLPTLPNIEPSVESLKHDVTVEDGSTVASIRISFEPAGTCGGDLDPVTGHDVILHGDSTNTTVNGSHFEDGSLNFEITNAEVNVQYSFSIVAFNSIGNTTSEESKCYTTDVQDASISIQEDDIVVTCSFAQGSQAQGCQIQLNSAKENITLNISRLNASNIVIEPSYSPACYDICAFDWEADGTIGQLCIPVSVNLSQFVSCGNPSESDKDTVTTDVQDASISMKEDDIVVTCSFAQGSQAQGCQIQLNSPMENITLNISRLNASDIVVKLSYSPTCYDICALDWEADGTIGELCIPVTVNLPQTEFASCSNPPEPDKESNTLLIIGVIVGVVVGFLIIVVVIAIVSYRCMRARQVRAKSKGYGNGSISVQIEDNCHPATEHSNSQPTTLPPIYDVVQNYTKQIVEFDTNVPAMYAAIGQQDTAAEEPKSPAVYDVIPNGRGHEFEHPEATPKEGAVPNPVYETVRNSARQSSDSTIKRMAENPMYSQPSELHKLTPYQVVTFDRQKQRDPNQIDLTENMSYGALPAPPNGTSTAPR